MVLVVVASAGFVVGDDVGLSDGLDVGLNVAVAVGVFVGVVVEAALVGPVVVVAGTLVVGTLVVGVPVVGTPVVGVPVVGAPVVGFLVVGFALGARLPTNGAGGAPQSLEILTSAQFQNCSGAPLPSGGSGPHCVPCCGLSQPIGQSYVSYPTWLHVLAVT